MSEQEIYRIGDTVIHPNLGQGVVIPAQEEEGFITVRFEAGVKHLSLQYANLQGANMSTLTQLTYHKDTDTYQANTAGYQITVSREAFEKLRRIYIREFVNGGMPEIPDAFERAQEFVLIAEYWIGDKGREGVNIVALSQ